MGKWGKRKVVQKAARWVETMVVEMASKSADWKVLSGMKSAESMVDL